MKSLIPILLVICFAACTTKPSGNSVNSDSDLEAFVDSLVRKDIDSLKAAGIAIGVFKGNEKLLLKSYGFADLEFDVKLPVDASFEIGSVTKQFTAAAMLQLVEQGKVNLDDDITKYVKFDTRGKKITVKQLLNHTSGIKGYTEVQEFEDLAVRKFKRDTLLRMIEKKDFDFEPGEALIYNNTGFFIAGLVIEKASGETYEDYISKNLFAKAGMSNSYYCSESKVTKNRAHGYDTGEKGLQRAAYLDHTWPYAAGSICSTVEDLVKWDQALHHGKILSEKMYQELLEPAVLNNGSTTHYAKGITVRLSNGKKMIEHGGGIFGFVSENRYFPEDDISIVVLVNTTGPVSPDYIGAHITTKLFGKNKEEKKPYAGDLSKFTGTFLGKGRGQDVKLKVAKADSLLSVSYGDNKPTPLYYTSEDLWTTGDTGYNFIESTGTVTGLGVDNIYGYYILQKEK